MKSIAQTTVAIILVVTIAAQSLAEPPLWEYHARVDEAGFKRPIYRSLKLSEQKPDELESKVQFRGNSQRYALLRYGTASSFRVGLLIDRVSSRDFDLYVDSNRDHVIMPKEKVSGSGLTRQLSLESELAKGELGGQMLPREVIFRSGTLTPTLSLATLGFLEGEVTIGDQTVHTRRVDGNGDGLFTHARDRIWLDLNHDGKWDGFSEQFAYSPILSIAKQRYAVKSDPAGQRLSVEELVGSGNLRLSFPFHDPDSIESTNVMFVGMDGSAFTIAQHDSAAVVPIGTYTIGVVQLVLRDAKTGKPWTYVFSDPGNRKNAPRYKVERDQTVQVDPIGQLRFAIKREGSQGKVAANQTLGLKPQIFTADGLLINSSVCGQAEQSFSGEGRARITLQNGNGMALHQTTSGFA